MHRIRQSVLIALAIVLVHAIVPHAHPWDDDHSHAVPLAAYAQADPTCSLTPLGALPPARPTWCSATTTGAPTFVQGLNSWRDEWQHGLSNANLGAGYQTFGFGSVAREQHFRHNQHWMVDVDGGGNKGGALMRPDRSFRAENGKLVVETEVAPSIATYGDAGGDVWPEIVVTTAPAPTFSRPDPLYAYDEFATHWTFGCRLQQAGEPICAIFDNTAGGPAQGARKYEISYFQQSGTDNFGGSPKIAGLAGVWKMCNAPDDPDLICRNQYRLELTATSVKLLVNGVRYFEQTGLPPYLQNLVNGQNVFVYMADTVFNVPRVVRFHWDHLAVNPEGATVVCSPRPPVVVRTAAIGSGRLQVTVTPGLGPLQALRFAAGANALIDIDGQTGRTGPFTVSLPPGTAQATFIVRRATAGVATTVPFFVTDGCAGEWSTFVGGGPTAV